MNSVTDKNVYVQRLGSTPDGRVVYKMKNDDLKYSMPEKDYDTFEKFWKATGEIADSKLNDKKHVEKVVATTSVATAIAGSALGALLTRKSDKIGKFFGVFNGLLIGAGIGIATSLYAIARPILKMSKIVKDFDVSNLDMKVYQEENQPEQKVLEKTV